jgi:hypothetical protein
LLLLLKHRTEFTGIEAGTAFNTEALIDLMRHLFLAGNSTNRASPGTHTAPYTLIFTNEEGQQLVTYLGWTFFILDMGFEIGRAHV